MDVMASFAIVYEGNVVDCSLEKEQIVEMFPLGTESIPLQSPLLWREYYRLMERPNKVEMIDKALGDKSMETKCETVVAPCLPQKEEAEPS